MGSFLVSMQELVRESLSTKLVFEVPSSAVHPAFALSSDLAINPSRIVIGDEGHFLHKPTIVPLD